MAQDIEVLKQEIEILKNSTPSLNN